MAVYGIKRLGLLVPPGNTAMETDFYSWMPDSVRLHTNRLYALPQRAKTMAEGLQAYGDHVEETTRLMAMAPVDVIAFGCTSGSFLNGMAYTQQIIQKMETASKGVKAVATARAAVDALHELGLKRIAVASPYPADINTRLKKFLAEAGFDVVNFAAWDPPFKDMSPEGAYQLGLSVDRPEAEAIFISCTAFWTGPMIERLEKATRKPVVTSNQATFWACMRAMGVEEPIPGAGKLLRERVAA